MQKGSLLSLLSLLSLAPLSSRVTCSLHVARPYISAQQQQGKEEICRRMTKAKNTHAQNMCVCVDGAPKKGISRKWEEKRCEKSADEDRSKRELGGIFLHKGYIPGPLFHFISSPSLTTYLHAVTRPRISQRPAACRNWRLLRLKLRPYCCHSLNDLGCRSKLMPDSDIAKSTE